MQFITKLDKQKKENKKIFKTKWIYRFFIYSFFCWLTENNYAKKHNVRDGKFTHVVYYTPLFTNESDSESKKCNFVYTFSISKKKKILDDPLQPTVFRNSLESTKKWCSKRSLEKKLSNDCWDIWRNFKHDQLSFEMWWYECAKSSSCWEKTSNFFVAFSNWQLIQNYWKMLWNRKINSYLTFFQNSWRIIGFFDALLDRFYVILKILVWT